ncbi:hypothetical protein ACP70R_046245 [Stipagrostis hirtigluma subsp. patula]
MSRKFMENFLKRKPFDDGNNVNVGSSRQRQEQTANNIRSNAFKDPEILVGALTTKLLKVWLTYSQQLSKC